MNTTRKGQLMMAICALMWSIGGILMKYIDSSPFFIAGIRSLIALFVVLIYMSVNHYKVKLNRKSVSAGVALCGCVTCFVIANKMTTAANAIVLQYIAPAFVLIISAVFFKQKLRKMEIGVVLLTFGGIILFFIDELDLGSLMGNFIAIASGLFMAIMFVFNSKIDDMSAKMSGILVAHSLTALIGIPVGCFTAVINLDERAILFLGILGVVQLGIPYVLYCKASDAISPLSCSLIGMIEPLLNPVWVALFYGEVPGIFAFIGGIIVIVSVIVYNVWDEKHSRDMQEDDDNYSVQQGEEICNAK